MESNTTVEKILLPPPNFERKVNVGPKPHYLTPSGMTLLPRDSQPPPMYGSRGSTVPPRYLPHARGRQKFQQVRPSNDRQFCELCDMELQSSDDLRLHRSQHEGCPVEGCKYRGHPSVMDKHINVLHATGLFDKFKKLSSPEEIAAWREERRKKYPTVANVEMRQRAQEQRQKRGERLEENKSRFGRRDDCRRGVNINKDPSKQVSTNKRKVRNRRNRKCFEKNARDIKSKEQEQLTASDEVNEVICCGIPMFKGTQLLKDYNHSSKTTAIEVNALSNLLIMYGSDIDDEEDYEEEEKECVQNTANDTHSIESNENMPTILNPVLAPDQNVTIKITNQEQPIIHIPVLNDDIPTGNKAQDSSDEAPTEIAILHSPGSVAASVPAPAPADNPCSSGNEKQPLTKRSRMQLQRARTTYRTRSGLDYRKARASKQNTMLEKLLETEIRHERNVLLQCVRYICENHFFGIGEKHKP